MSVTASKQPTNCSLCHSTAGYITPAFRKYSAISDKIAQKEGSRDCLTQNEQAFANSKTALETAVKKIQELEKTYQSPFVYTLCSSHYFLPSKQITQIPENVREEALKELENAENAFLQIGQKVVVEWEKNLPQQSGASSHKQAELTPKPQPRRVVKSVPIVVEEFVPTASHKNPLQSQQAKKTTPLSNSNTKARSTTCPSCILS